MEWNGKHDDPTIATPVFSVQKLIRGLSNDVEVALSKVIHVEAQRLRGSEMVFQIITTAQEWIADWVQPPSEASGSLATEMTRRANQEEREQQESEEAEAERQSELAARVAEQLQEQLQADAQKHLIAKEMQYKAARRRAQSDATEVPSVGDTLTESFPIKVEFRGIRFNAVKMFHPRKERLGVTYLADPLCDDVHATLPSKSTPDTTSYETFVSSHRSSSIGNSIRTTSGLTLQDVLEDCDSLREDRAAIRCVDYLAQILSALNAVHSSDLVHQGLDTTCIFLATRENKSHTKLVKVGKVGYHARLKDLHKSNPFSSSSAPVNDEYPIPDPWCNLVDCLLQSSYGTSPEKDYFRVPPSTRQVSRWKEDWEELELLGRGAFGSVVKARNRIDSRIYAVKEICLRTDQSDTKIFREVNALSRLSHRFVVGYYTTWVETVEVVTSGPSSNSDTASNSATEDNMTSVPHSFERRETSDPFSIDLSELDDYGGSGSRSSFPSIHFTRSDVKDEKDEDEDDSDDGFAHLFTSEYTDDVDAKPPVLPRILYIQMEFVERQTLKERVAEGLSEEEDWHLFNQILEVLVHMGSMGIMTHSDSELTLGKHEFVDACNLYLLTPHPEVGTKLYIAPEVLSRKKGPRNHNKADMYSLGIVFFEMNYVFSTGAERIAVIEDLRKPEVYFPRDWEAHHTRQKEIILWLLRHDPAKWPSSLELSQSSLLPPRVGDEYFKEAINICYVKSPLAQQQED
ncbi:kinase-like domain-containing protein [Boletus edulis BED1]|uniref:Kinase-like domain-containing protein n=1 Tax=Boletus edulis BED1 TaxID=1328754 RepID=A0AAD4BE64_BOLED|nr:kinase-like domain-containing protein [Boletus edulis BED1]